MSQPSQAAISVPPLGAQFNFAAHLIALNAARPGKTAYIDDAGTLSYGELADRVQRMAAGLLGLGLRREERVLLLMHDSSDWVVAFLGALYAGVVPVAVNTLLTADDYAYMLQHSRAQAALVSGALLPTLQQAMAKGTHEVGPVIVSRPSQAPNAPAQDMQALLQAHAPLAQCAASQKGWWRRKRRMLAQSSGFSMGVPLTAQRCAACRLMAAAARLPSSALSFFFMVASPAPPSAICTSSSTTRCQYTRCSMPPPLPLPDVLSSAASWS